ncbi:Pof family protein [Megaselia abdita]
MKIKSSGYGKNNHDLISNSKWKNSPTNNRSSSAINSKHKQYAKVSPYSRTLPTYNAQAHSSYWQQQPPPPSYWSSSALQSQQQQQVTQTNITQQPPPPPLPPMPSDNDVPPMPPPPPSTTPPPLHPDEKLAGRTNQLRKDQGKHCNSISSKTTTTTTTVKSVYSAPAINYVNNIPRSQQPSTHLKYNNSTSMTSGTSSSSEKNLLLKTVGSYGGFNGYLPEGEFGVSGGGTSISLYENDNKCHLVERKRRRTTANRYDSGEKWVLEEAVKALEVENQYSVALNAKSLTINFPDVEISKTGIQEFSDAIVNVHVISPITPRFCVVTLKDDSNVEEVIERISKIPFGNGFLSARLKPMNEEIIAKPECIEPRTLYIGNLSPTICAKTLKDKFEKSTRMDIGYAQKMKFTRWAFVKFANVDDAIEAYKMTVNTMMDNRSLIVRFRRVKNNSTNLNCRKKFTPKMDENECKKNETVTTETTTSTMTMKPTIMTTSLVEQDKNESKVKDVNVEKECIENEKNTPLRNSSISKEQSIAGDEDDDDYYDDDDDDILPSNILTALPSSVVLQERSKSNTCSNSIAPPSPLMQEEDAIFEPPIRADIIMDTPSPSLPSNTPTQDEGTPNHLTEQLILPSLLLDVDDDDDDEVNNGHINPPNEENSSCNVGYNMPLLDTPQSSLSIHDESLSFDTPLLLRGPTEPEDNDEEDDDDVDDVPPPKEMPFKDNNKKTQMKSTMQDSCDITCFFSLDSTRVPALLEAETSDEVMARLSNEATPLPSPLFHEDDDNDYQVYDKTPPKSRSNRSTISCSLGHLQSQSNVDNLSAHLTSSGSKCSGSLCSSAEKDYYQIDIETTPPKEKSPAIKTGSARKNFSLENGFNCYDWSFSEDEFQPDCSDDKSALDKEIQNVGLLGAADENQSDDREEDLSNCDYVDFDEDVYDLSDEDTALPASKRRKTNKEKTDDQKKDENSRVLTDVEIKRESIEDSGEVLTDDAPQEHTNCDFVAFEEEDTYALSNVETTLPNCNLNKMTPVNECNNDECSDSDELSNRRRRHPQPEVLSELEIKTEEEQLRENGQPHTGGGGSSFGSDVSNASTVDDWNNSGKKPLEWTDCELEYDLFSQLNSNNDNFLSTV